MVRVLWIDGVKCGEKIFLSSFIFWVVSIPPASFTNDSFVVPKAIFATCVECLTVLMFVMTYMIKISAPKGINHTVKRENASNSNILPHNVHQDYVPSATFYLTRCITTTHRNKEIGVHGLERSSEKSISPTDQNIYRPIGKQNRVTCILCTQIYLYGMLTFIILCHLVFFKQIFIKLSSMMA